MAQAQNFDVALKRFEKMAGDRMGMLARATTLEIHRRVTELSPVDTGRFRGNWMIGLNNVPTTYDWERYDKEGGSTIMAAMAAIAPYTGEGFASIVNNIEYGPELEGVAGGPPKSKQAPNGMVRITVAEADQIALSIAREFSARKWKKGPATP